MHRLGRGSGRLIFQGAGVLLKSLQSGDKEKYRVMFYMDVPNVNC